MRIKQDTIWEEPGTWFTISGGPSYNKMISRIEFTLLIIENQGSSLAPKDKYLTVH